MSFFVYGASVQGAGHARADLPCQDAHGWRVVRPGICCAVADGLGSAARAEEGSRIAVAAALEALVKSSEAGPGWETPNALEESVRKAFRDARHALELQCDASSSLGDLATTLLVAVVTDNATAIGQIGDGGIVGRWESGELAAFSAPTLGEYVNEVEPLTSSNALERITIRSWPMAARDVALFSDGLQTLAMNLATGLPFSPFFEPFFNIPIAEEADVWSERLFQFLLSERVCKRTEDDKTLVVAKRVE